MDRGDLWVGDAMSGKGDKRRPMTVQYDLFESNWDRIFRRKQIEEQWTPEVKDKMLREVTYDGEKVGTFDATNLREVAHDGMWKHSCTTMMETLLHRQG